ncbi:MAG TPA: cyclopropane-fatty-acyl-phospholipid synthase family protein [Myxococcaceae bacterium]|nr:cyclopropane-fatty-acyl-phospholipid synthase family protein [Myxococcaceae bacterium]
MTTALQPSAAAPNIDLASPNGKKLPMAAFVEKYVKGEIQVSGDLQAFFRRKEDVLNYRMTWEQMKFVVGGFIPSVLIHTQAADRKTVTGHYDRGNDFFNAFLGDIMIYTSAFFESPADTLEEAQRRKLEVVAQKIQLKPGERLLDIGCGWGTLVAHMAEKHGADATGVTLAARQAEFGTERIAQRGLQQRARILTMDYRDIPRERWNKITVLEMAEHVGIRKFQKFMRQLNSMLEEDGVLFLQIAGLRRNWTAEDFTWGMFMSKYVFPGADASMPLSFVCNKLERAGFEIHSVENIGIHYSMTIDRWYRNWLKNRDAVVKSYGERWFRLWEIFLAWSTLIAEHGGSTAFQLVCNKNKSSFDRKRWIGERGRLVDFPEA